MSSTQRHVWTSCALAYFISVSSGGQCPQSASYVPAHPIGYNGTAWYGTGANQEEYNSSQATVSCCDSGRIAQWGIQSATARADSSPPRVARIAAVCTDSSNVNPVTMGFNGTDQPSCDGLYLFSGATFVPSIQATGPVRSNFTYKSDGSILTEYLGVGDNTADYQEQWFQCSEGLAPVGISASSNCFGLNSFQIICDTPLSPQASPEASPDTPPSTAAQQSAETGDASHDSGGGGLSYGDIAAIALAAALAVALALLLWLVLVKRRQWQGASGLGPGNPYTSRSQLQDTLCQQPDDLQYQQLELGGLSGAESCQARPMHPTT